MSGEGTAPRFFDGHCDTALWIADEGVDFVGGDASVQVDWPRLQSAGVRAQVFACFVLSERYPGAEAQRAETLLSALDEVFEPTDGGIRAARSASDLRASFDKGGPISAVFALEGADPLCGKAENLRAYSERGVRSLIFAWKDNPFSGSAFGRNGPLTGEGRRLLGLCEELRVLVDVSHASDAAFEEICQAATRPFIASHSNCRALSPSPRNLTDEMIRAVADRGGVMGINLAPAFLSPESYVAWKRIRRQLLAEGLPWREAERRARQIASTVPRPAFGWIVRHVLHAIDVGGEDVVGLGGDLDGIVQMPDGIDGVEGYPRIAEALHVAGLSEVQVEKVCFRNLLRAFEDVLGD